MSIPVMVIALGGAALMHIRKTKPSIVNLGDKEVHKDTGKVQKKTSMSLEINKILSEQRQEQPKGTFISDPSQKKQLQSQAEQQLKQQQDWQLEQLPAPVTGVVLHRL